MSQATKHYITAQPSPIYSLFPGGYNREQLAQDQIPFSVNLDWLTVNLTLALPAPDFSKSKYFDYEDTGRPGRSFAHLVKVYYCQNFLGTLSFKPHSPKWSQDLAQFQFSNESLYYAKEELYQICLMFLDTIQASFKTISRIDLALDFPEDSPLFFDPRSLITGLVTGEFLLSGREKALNLYSQVVKGQVQINGFSIGSRDSDNRFMRCYNKTLEITENPKPYISQIHEKMNSERPIWRLEFQLGNKFLSLLKGLDLRSCFQFRDYLEVISLAVKNFFEIHINMGSSEVNKNPKVFLIRWQKIFQLFPVFEAVDLTKFRRNQLNDKHESVKRLIKGNFKEYYKNQPETLTLETAVYLSLKYDLMEFFKSKVEEWIFEFDEKRKILQTLFNWELFASDFEAKIQVVKIKNPDLEIHKYNRKKDYVSPRFMPSNFDQSHFEPSSID